MFGQSRIDCLIDCMLGCRLTIVEFSEVKGKLLIAQSRKEKKEEELKAFFYPKGAQCNP